MAFLKRKGVFRKLWKAKNRKCRNFFGIINKFFPENFLVALRGNLKQDECLPAVDARVPRTGVSNTEKPRQWSKTPILAAKMLKIRKKCPARALFWLLSGKFTLKNLTSQKK